jgi:hypothetical protein
MKPEDVPVGFVRKMLKLFIERSEGHLSAEQIMQEYEYVLKNWGGWEDLNFSMADSERWEYAFYMMKADLNTRRRVASTTS